MIITLVLKTLMRKGQGPYDGSNWIKIIDPSVGGGGVFNKCLYSWILYGF